MCFFSLNFAIGLREKSLRPNLNAFESSKTHDYFDQILFIRNKHGRSYDIICPPKSRKIAFFRYFLSLNEVDLKFKEPLWKQHI